MSSGHSPLQLQFGSPLTKGVKFLILSNVAVFVLQIVSGQTLTEVLGLTPAQVVGQLHLWQIFTYMFLHGGVFHLAFNMLALWMFGSDLERLWGTGRFTAYYLITGMGGGVTTLITSAHSQVATIGASGAIFGLLLAFGLLFPNRMVLVFLLFPMPAKYFVTLFAAIELLATFSYAPDGIGRFAHLGGMVVGFFYLKLEERCSARLAFHRALHREEQVRRRIETTMSYDEFIRTQIDPILDKIRKHGMHSLTRRERKLLKQASSRRH